MINKVRRIFSKKYDILSSNSVNISTKYGLFQAQFFTTKDHQYIVVKSPKFDSNKNPILYFHVETHLCSSTQDNVRYCSSPIDMILRMFKKENGLFIYYSKTDEEIAELLNSWNTRTLGVLNKQMKKSKTNIDPKIEIKEFHSLGFVFQDLNLSSVRLITSSTKVAALLELLDIKISKSIPLLSFQYGK